MREYWVVRRERDVSLRGFECGTPYCHADYWTGDGKRRPLFGPLGRAVVFREKGLLKAEHVKQFPGMYAPDAPLFLQGHSWHFLTPDEIEKYLRHRARILFSLRLTTPFGIVADRYRDAGMDEKADDCAELQAAHDRRRRAEDVTESLRRVNEKNENKRLVANMRRRIVDLERGS